MVAPLNHPQGDLRLRCSRGERSSPMEPPRPPVRQSKPPTAYVGGRVCYCIFVPHHQVVVMSISALVSSGTVVVTSAATDGSAESALVVMV